MNSSVPLAGSIIFFTYKQMLDTSKNQIDENLYPSKKGKIIHESQKVNTLEKAGVFIGNNQETLNYYSCMSL